ncbi:MAG TPA: hypothetical protein VLF88_02230 [Candidatus Babeliales bacterium]|nr:hypothetical protein [Candidatus Babeliales bacterium]
MSAFWVSLLFALGIGTWIFTKFQRYSGNNTKQSVIGTAVSALIIFFVSYTILRTLFKNG